VYALRRVLEEMQSPKEALEGEGERKKWNGRCGGSDRRRIAKDTLRRKSSLKSAGTICDLPAHVQSSE
jgi:hypothetical protein